jgi:hypothetical protein
MTHCAIVEQFDIKKDCAQSASTYIGKHHDVVCNLTYTNESQFETSLMQAICALHMVERDLPKVLILSAHGVPLTGTNLATSGSEEIDLCCYERYFSVLPHNLVIYISACFGGFPAARIAQSDKINTPYVVGPLVDIQFGHANDFQSRLLDLANQPDLSRKSLYRLIRTFNRANFRHEYGQRQLFGMYDRSGNFFPREVIGTQLAARIEPEMRFSVENFIYSDGSSEPAACVIKNDRGVLLQANLGPFLKFSKNIEDLIGRRFSGRFQIVHPAGERISVIHLLRVRR